MKIDSVSLAAAAVAVWCASPGFAQLAADTMPGASGYSTSMFYPVSGPIGQRIGWRFTAAAGGVIEEIVTPMRSAGGEATPSFFEVYTDVGGVGGVLLGTATGTVPTALPGSPALVSFDPVGTITLVEGVDYWVTFGRSQVRTVEWYVAAPLLGGPHWWQDGSGGSYYATADYTGFRVTVPAPGGACVLALLLIGRRRR